MEANSFSQAFLLSMNCPSGMALAFSTRYLPLQTQKQSQTISKDVNLGDQLIQAPLPSNRQESQGPERERNLPIITLLGGGLESKPPDNSSRSFPTVSYARHALEKIWKKEDVYFGWEVGQSFDMKVYNGSVEVGLFMLVFLPLKFQHLHTAARSTENVLITHLCLKSP